MEGWITTDEAAALTGYEPAYLRRLLNQGRIPARKVGRDWLVNRDALLAHKAQMDALGKSKHDPWRQDLAEQGRGRRRGGQR
jgi:excisionase family DNA binding protein